METSDCNNDLKTGQDTGLRIILSTHSIAIPIISEVCKRIILHRLNTHIEERKLIPNEQFGFRTKHNTIEQVHSQRKSTKSWKTENTILTYFWMLRRRSIASGTRDSFTNSQKYYRLHTANEWNLAYRNVTAESERNIQSWSLSKPVYLKEASSDQLSTCYVYTTFLKMETLPWPCLLMIQR